MRDLPQGTRRWFATVVTARETDFRWIRGAEYMETYPCMETYPSSKELNRLFCRVCGSSLAVTKPRTGEVFVTAGTLDEDPGIRLESLIFVASKAPRPDILDEKPRFDEYPPGPD
jgi:hypothetical protein